MSEDKTWREGLRLADPIPPVPSVDAARAAAEAFRPCNPDVATQAAKALDEAQEHARTLLADETTCRATPSCNATRVAERAAAKAAAEAAAAAQAAEAKRKETIEPLCFADFWLEDNKRIIREEKANASGVVDLSVLHDAGDAIRIHNAQIAALKPVLHRRWRGWRLECPGMDRPAIEDLRLPGAQ